MRKSWSGQVAIVGIGESEIGSVPHKTPMQLHAEAARAALEDCGLEKADIDGVLTAGITNPMEIMHSVLVVRASGDPAPVHHIHAHRRRHADPAGHQRRQRHPRGHGGCGAHRLGRLDPVFRGVRELDEHVRESATDLLSSIGHAQFELPYGPTLISAYALAATRHMHDFGTTQEQLAQVAVSIRKHASLHPTAQKRKPRTIDQVLASKMISWPLTKDMCSVVSDGGGALVVTSLERARDLKKKPVTVLGAGARTFQEHLSLVDDLVRTGAVDAGRQAYEMSGLGPKDMDFAEFYDCFSITPILFLEDFGFCEKGEGGRFVEGGARIEIGGEIPIVTHGGCHAHCHPGTPSGLFHIIEAVKQLRGEAEEKRQVKDARVGLINGLGGHFSSHTALIVGTD